MVHIAIMRMPLNCTIEISQLPYCGYRCGQQHTTKQYNKTYGANYLSCPDSTHGYALDGHDVCYGDVYHCDDGAIEYGC